MTFTHKSLSACCLCAAALASSLPCTAETPSAPPIVQRIVATRYPSSDQVVAAYTDRDWKMDRTGKADSSVAIQNALNAIGASGGGTLFLSSGVYRLDYPITAPAGVTIRGEIGATSDSYRYQGTILAAYASEGKAEGPSLVTLTTCAGIRDCIIWYPRQDPTNVIPFPPSVNHASSSTSVDNVVFVNSYQAYRSGYKMGGRAYVRNVRGTALSIGIEIDAIADTGRVEGVDLSPEYWAHSGLPGSPTTADRPYRQFMLKQGIGIMERRIDWTNTADVKIDGYNKGYYTTYSINEEDLGRHRLTVSPNGENYNYTIRNCVYGVYMECCANAGMIFTHFDIQASKIAYYLGEKCDTNTTLLDSTLSSPGNAIENHGPGRILVSDCTFESGGIAGNGVLDCVSSTFAKAACRIFAGDTLANASFFNDTFLAAPAITGSDISKASIHMESQPGTPRQSFHAEPIDFEAPRGAKSKSLFVVTQPPFGAVGDGKTDCSAAFQSAIQAAAQAGGGIVFVPGGVYDVTTPLTIPAGVELRGAFDGPHDANTAGSCILVATGQGHADGPAFLTLKSNSTVRGLNFHYPGQEIANIVDFPFLIKGVGANITIADVASANVSRFIDLMSQRCDNAFIDHIEGQPIHIGIQVGAGSRDVSISDCQFNPSNWTFATIFNAPKVEYPDRAKRGAIVNAYIQRLQEHGVVFVLGDCTGLKFYRDFVFAGRYGMRCIAENGHGPSGVCLELGVDGSTTALRIDAIGAQGFPFINSQLVVTSKLEGQRHPVELGEGFNGTARLYGLNEWSPSTDSAFQVLGGALRADGAYLRDPGNPAWDVHNGGTLTVNASCVRRDAPLLANSSQAAPSINITGNILPETAHDLPWLNAASNLIYTDVGAKRPVGK